mmetsp:Transcript_134283/g.233373  ORF Transcript_134283/g.233373 Transcript_134283/m.233373 type:complete len:1088 (+) Transcript_134283:116-3379(+)
MIVVQSPSYAPAAAAAPQSGVMHSKQAPQVRPLGSNFPTGMQAQFVGAPAEGNRSNSRMVSPRPRRVISPRPCYSWRSQYSQPVASAQSGLSAQMVETGSLTTRLPSSRYGAPPVSNANQPRSFKPPTRARTPELQTRHRDRQRVEVAARALQVQPARSLSTERSLSSDRLRSARHAGTVRPRTISPEERARHAALAQGTRQNVRMTSAELPSTGVQPVTHVQLRAWLTGGAGSALQARREACRLRGTCEGNLERTPPSAKERSPNSPAAGSTNRSRSCSPSTVPRVLSGSGSPQDVVDVTPPQHLSDRESFERSGSAGNGSGAGDAARRALGVAGLGSGLSGVGFRCLGGYHKESKIDVHVDNPTALQNEAPLPPARYHGVLTECDVNSPINFRRQWDKEANDGKDRKRPLPLSDDGFSANAENICSPLPVDLNDSSCTSISFNLSPIKAPLLSGGGHASSADSLRGALTYSDTISNGFSLPASSRVTPSASGAPSLLPSRRESPKDKENVVIMGQAAESPSKPKGSSERAVSHNSKVFELISHWEQQAGGRSSASSSHRRSSRPSAAKRAVSSPCWIERAPYPCCADKARYLGQKEAITLRAAQDLLKRINSINKAGVSPGGSESSLEAHNADVSESLPSEDSPMKTTRDEICARLDKGWRLQRKYMKCVERFVLDCEGGAISSASSQGMRRSVSDEECRLPSNTARGRSGSGEQFVAAPQGSPSRGPLTPTQAGGEASLLEATLTSLPALQCLKPHTPEPVEGSDARETSLAKSPTAATQPEEEADGPLAPVATKGSDDAKGEDLHERGRDADATRFSTASTVAGEPAMEPQPLESPRPTLPEGKAAGEPDDEPISVVQDTIPGAEGAAEQSISTEPPISPSAAESPEGHAFRRQEEPQEGEGEEGNEEESSEEEEEDEPLEDWQEFGARPGEEGMDRAKTVLYHLECAEMKKEIKIIVPAEVCPDRKVSFKFQGMSHEIVVPEGYDVGAEVPVTLTKRPFLERNPKHGHFRGHAPELFPDRGCIFENLRHSPRTNKDDSKLDERVFKDRYYWYSLLRGNQGCPLLEYTPEEREEDLAEEVELS